jgi:hypothetical protein
MGERAGLWASERTNAGLVEAARLLTGDQLAALVNEYAPRYGADRAVIYLADLQQAVLGNQSGVAVGPDHISAGHRGESAQPVGPRRCITAGHGYP